MIEVKRGVERVDTKVDEVKSSLSDVKTTLEGQIKTSVNNDIAIQLDSLCKWLNDAI